MGWANLKAYQLHKSMKLSFGRITNLGLILFRQDFKLIIPRNFRSRKQLWVLFGLLAVSFRILTGAPEAQVNFTSLFVDQNTQVISQEGVAKLLQNTVAENSTDANSIPEKHHTYSTYKKYISPDNHFANLAHSVQYSIPVVPKIDFAPWVAKETQKIKPNSHSPPAVVSAHSLTYTTTTGNSVVTENNFGEFKVNNSTWGLGRL